MPIHPVFSSRFRDVFLAVLCCGLTVSAMAQDKPEKNTAVPDPKHMWRIIQQQQRTIEALQAELEQQKQQLVKTRQDLGAQEENLNIMAEVVETTSVPASATTVGGYGELHYNNTDRGNKVDFHRFVLFVGHDFSDKTRFYSEIELEHAYAADGKPGAVELEQAFIEHRLSEKFTANAGMILMPVGIINETHEPETFFGVERNPIAKHILPTTWREAGLGGHWRVNGQLQADLLLSSGLDVPTEGANAFLIRSGRQSVANAISNKGAITGRVRYRLTNGLQLAATVHHQQDITQGQLGIAATLLEANAQYRNGPFGLRAVMAQWRLDNKVAELAPGREKQSGYYLEPSWRFGERDKLGVFARYSVWDNKAGSDDQDDAIKQWNLGMNYWLHPRVVFKLDYQDQSGASDNDGINLGVGYSF